MLYPDYNPVASLNIYPEYKYTQIYGGSCVAISTASLILTQIGLEFKYAFECYRISPSEVHAQRGLLDRPLGRFVRECEDGGWLF